MRIRVIVAAPAGGGAALAVLVLSFWPGLFAAMLFGALDGPVIGLVPVALLGVLCGFTGGYVGASFALSLRGWAAFGAWVTWALVIASLVATKFIPNVFGLTALPAGFAAALIGAGLQARGTATTAPGRLIGAALLGALGAFAVLTLGVAALGYVAQSTSSARR